MVAMVERSFPAECRLFIHMYNRLIILAVNVLSSRLE
jgi:hypothetical protein